MILVFGNLKSEKVKSYLYWFAIFFNWLKWEFYAYCSYHQDNSKLIIVMDWTESSLFSLKWINFISNQNFLNFGQQTEISHQLMFVLRLSILTVHVNFFIPDSKFLRLSNLSLMYWSFMNTMLHLHLHQLISM